MEAFTFFLEMLDPLTRLIYEENADFLTWMTKVNNNTLTQFFKYIDEYEGEEKELIKEQIKEQINNNFKNICTNDNTFFYKTLVKYGLDVEKHKNSGCIKNKKIVPVICFVSDTNNEDYINVLGIYNSEFDALDDLIKFLIIYSEYFDKDYENKYANEDYRKYKLKDIDILLERFKTENNGHYLKQLLDNTYHRMTHNDFYYRFNQVNESVNQLT